MRFSRTNSYHQPAGFTPRWYRIMQKHGFINAVGTALICAWGANAQYGTCSNVLKSSYSAPVVGSGWVAQLVATNLTKPRSILWDNSGHLLVVEQGIGIRRLSFNDNGTTCLEVSDSSSVVEDGDVRLFGEHLAMNLTDEF